MEKWNDCVNGWLFSDRKETRKGKVRWGKGEKKEQGRGGVGAGQVDETGGDKRM